MISLLDRFMLAVMIILISAVNSLKITGVFRMLGLLALWIVFWMWFDRTFISISKLQELKDKDKSNDS